MSKNFVSYDGMITLLDIEYGINDYAIWKWSWEDKKHRTKIKYNSKNEPFIKCGDNRYYLNEFIKY